MRRSVCLAGALLALSATTALAAPPAGTWTGKLDEYTSKLHFKVAGARVKGFTVPEAPAYCMTGFSVISIVVPSAAIHGRTFSGSEHITYDGETERIRLTGAFKGRAATGHLELKGPCHATLAWKAHR